MRINKIKLNNDYYLSDSSYFFSKKNKFQISKIYTFEKN